MIVSSGASTAGYEGTVILSGGGGAAAAAAAASRGASVSVRAVNLQSG